MPPAAFLPGVASLDPTHATRDGLIGMLKIAARHPGSLNSYDAELVEQVWRNDWDCISVLRKS